MISYLKHNLNPSFSDSRNKYRNHPFNTKLKIPTSSSLLENHIIITPTSTGNARGNEIQIPRFGSRKDNMRSSTKLDMSDERSKTQLNIDSALSNTTWENISFKKQPKPRPSTNEPVFRLEDTTVEETKDNRVKPEPSLAQTFLNECETLEEAITNLLREIDVDTKQSEQTKQEK